MVGHGPTIVVSLDMGAVATRNSADWLDLKEYPFEPKRLSVEGGRIHYVDEGAGPVLLFVHGTQTWSFLFRHLIKALQRDYRCVAIDHLGFGLSDKPVTLAGTPAQHARNLTRLIDYLDLRDITMIGHDCGGPIAMSYAEAHPQSIARMIFMNTWMWGLKGDSSAQRIGRFVSNGVGRFLYTKVNLSTKFIRPLFNDKSMFTESAHNGYFGPFQDGEHRFGPLRLSEAMLGEHAWYEDLWENRRNVPAPVLLLWGMKDPSFGERYLNRMWSGFPLAEVKKLESCGHFPPEEAPTDCIDAIQSFVHSRAAALI